MRLFLTILEGPNPGEAEPILATEDEGVIQAVVARISDRLAQGNRTIAPGDGVSDHDVQLAPPADGRQA